MSQSTRRCFACITVSIASILIFAFLFAPNSFSRKNPDGESIEDPNITLWFDPPTMTIRSAGNLGGQMSRLYWTVDDPSPTANRFVVAPMLQCPYTIPNCTQPSWEFTFSAARFCDGENHHMYAQANGNSYFQRAILQTNPFNCTGGGSSLPQPTELPVVFVPGIMGSVIKGPSGIQYWPNFAFTGNPAIPSARNLTLDANSPYYRAGLYATDAIRSVYTRPQYQTILDNLSGMGFGSAYDINRHFEQGLGCDYSLRNTDPTMPPTVKLFVFPYDWRQDINLTASQFKDYVQCVQRLYPPGTRVNVVAHSMGGLLVRRYILQSQQNNEPYRLGKVVTIASPFLGAPEATFKLYTGGSFEFPTSIFITPSTYQFLAPHIPGMHQLLPSRKYRQFRGAIMGESGDIDGNGIPNEIYGFDQVIQVLNADFSTLPGSAGGIFHDYPGQDDWRSDSSGIKYFHIFGTQKQWNTTDAVYIYKSVKCRRSGNRLTGCFRNKLYVPQKGPGDRTVPYVSSSMGWVQAYIGTQITDLAPPGMRIFWRKSLSSSTDGQAEHTGLTQDAKVRDLIKYILGVGPQPTWDSELYELSRPTSLATTAKADLTEYSPSYYLKILGQTDVSVRDQMGNTAAIENGILRNDVPGLNECEMIADDSFMLTLTTTDSYTVDFKSGTTPMGIEFIKGIGSENLESAVRYNNIDLPANVNIRLTISPTGAVELRVDTDNDGTFETVVSPTVNLSGSAASDLSPPIVSINLIAGSGNTATAHITADDFGSGVSKIWYSTDGQYFDQYVGPILLTLSSTPITIEAFAEDNAANRSGLISKTVSLAPTVIPIAECIERDSDGYKAWFGYQNQTTASFTVPVGADNIFYPLPGNKGQITTFQPGVASRSFSVRMTNGKRLDWKLRGSDGLLRTATAMSPITPQCQ